MLRDQIISNRFVVDFCATNQFNVKYTVHYCKSAYLLRSIEVFFTILVVSYMHTAIAL